MTDPGAAELDKVIAQATVDANGEDEQLMGFHDVLEENLAVPFDTIVLGVPVTVKSVTLTSSGITAICVRGKYQQQIHLLDLPLPTPPPPGAHWIAAYRRWAG